MFYSNCTYTIQVQSRALDVCGAPSAWMWKARGAMTTCCPQFARTAPSLYTSAPCTPAPPAPPRLSRDPRARGLSTVVCVCRWRRARRDRTVSSGVGRLQCWFVTYVIWRAISLTVKQKNKRKLLWWPCISYYLFLIASTTVLRRMFRAIVPFLFWATGRDGGMKATFFYCYAMHIKDAIW